MQLTVETFIAKWSASGAAERANKDSFLNELCDVLGVPRPDSTKCDEETDRYVFEKAARMPHETGVVTVGKIDLYKAGYFILEAKQGSEENVPRTSSIRANTTSEVFERYFL